MLTKKDMVSKLFLRIYSCLILISLQKISQNSAMERLTDTSKYGGTHKQRFTPDGKGKGKEGRVDDKPLAFREIRKGSRS